MMLELECVGDPLTASVGHENSNALIVFCSMQSVPCLGCMIAPHAPTIRFHVD